MAAAKNTFEPKNFAANSFACGVWRGIGAVVRKFIHYTATPRNQDYTAQERNPDYRAKVR